MQQIHMYKHIHIYYVYTYTNYKHLWRHLVYAVWTKHLIIMKQLPSTVWAFLNAKSYAYNSNRKGHTPTEIHQQKQQNYTTQKKVTENAALIAFAMRHITYIHTLVAHPISDMIIIKFCFQFVCATSLPPGVFAHWDMYCICAVCGWVCFWYLYCIYSFYTSHQGTHIYIL